MYDILVYGPIFCDLIYTGLDHFPALGKESFADDLVVSPGGNAIVAIALHRLDTKVGLIADLGNDPISQLIANMLTAEGLDLSLVRQHPYSLKQITTALSYPHDRAFITRFERADSAVNLEAVLQNHPAKHLHIGGFFAAAENPEVVQIAHRYGLTVSLDPGWDDNALVESSFYNLLAELDFFMPNEKELCYISQQEHVDEALASMAEHIDGAIVLKQGAQGALVRQGQAQTTVKAYPVTAIDTTGAGDSFDAGFLYGYTEGEDLERCLTYGAICGALSTRAAGIVAIPDLKEVKSWLIK